MSLDYSKNRPPTAHALEIFDRCLRALEVKPSSIDLFANDLEGERAAGMACFIDGFPTVLYKPDAFARLEIASRNGWGCCKVLAHEIGHHVWRRKRGDGQWGESSWEGELAADYYAGFAMARLGAGVADIDDYFTWNFDPDGTKDHPDTVLRMRALRRGFIDGGGEGSPETDLDTLYASYWKRMTQWWPDGHPEHPKKQRLKKT